MKKLFLLFMISLLCTACGKEEATSATSETIQPIEVQIKTNPEAIYTGEKITIEAIVTQGNDKVDNANEVMFEIWQSGKDEHEMIKATHRKGGMYSIEKTFTEEGTYYLTAHTTARDMHVMPQEEIKVELK